MAAQEEKVRGAQEAQATGSAQLSQEVRALRSAVGDKETALAAIKVLCLQNECAALQTCSCPGNLQPLFGRTPVPTLPGI